MRGEFDPQQVPASWNCMVVSPRWVLASVPLQALQSCSATEQVLYSSNSLLLAPLLSGQQGQMVETAVQLITARPATLYTLIGFPSEVKVSC